MMDYVAIIVITLFVPVLVIGGAKLYNYKNDQKLLKAFAIVLLAIDLLRFFYNAKLFNKATTPASELRFSYLTLYSIMVMFSAFASGKLGVIFKKATLYTSLIPLVIGLLNPSVYVNSLDTHAVIKACYFVECGLAVLVGFLCNETCPCDCKKAVLFGVLGYAVYLAFNVLTLIFWNTGKTFDLIWFITVGVSIVSIALIFILKTFIKKPVNKNE